MARRGEAARSRNEGFPRKWREGYFHVHTEELDDWNDVDLLSEIFEEEGDDEEEHLHDG